MPQILLPRALPGANAFVVSLRRAGHTVEEYAGGRTADVITLPIPSDGRRAFWTDLAVQARTR